MHNLRASMHKPSPFRSLEKDSSHPIEKEDPEH